MDWRHHAACRDVDPELFFPIGNTGPALLQIDEAKQVCQRCNVMEPCLQWALESGQDAGVWGGLSEDERRALKRRQVAAHHGRAHTPDSRRDPPGAAGASWSRLAARSAARRQMARARVTSSGSSTSDPVPPPGCGAISSRPPSSASTSVRTICRPRLVVDSRSKSGGQARRRCRYTVTVSCPCPRLAETSRHPAQRLPVGPRQPVLQGVLQQLGQHQRQRSRDRPRAAGRTCRAGRGVTRASGADDLAGHHRHPAGDVVEVHDLVRDVRQRLVHHRDRADPADGLLQRRPRLRRLQPPRLQPQQRRDRLQVVLDPVVDLPDGGVLGEQLALPVPQLGHVPEQDQRPGPRPVHDQRDRAQLHDRAVAPRPRSPRARGRWPSASASRRGARRPAHSRAVSGPSSLADQVSSQPEPPVGRQRVRAGVGDLARAG